MTANQNQNMEERNYRSEIERIEIDARLKAAEAAAVRAEICAELEVRDIEPHGDLVGLLHPYILILCGGDNPRHVGPILDALRFHQPVLTAFFAPQTTTQTKSKP